MPEAPAGSVLPGYVLPDFVVDPGACRLAALEAERASMVRELARLEQQLPAIQDQLAEANEVKHALRRQLHARPSVDIRVAAGEQQLQVTQLTAQLSSAWDEIKQLILSVEAGRIEAQDAHLELERETGVFAAKLARHHVDSIAHQNEVESLHKELADACAKLTEAGHNHERRLDAADTLRSDTESLLGQRKAQIKALLLQVERLGAAGTIATERADAAEDGQRQMVVRHQETHSEGQRLRDALASSESKVSVLREAALTEAAKMTALQTTADAAALLNKQTSGERKALDIAAANRERQLGVGVQRALGEVEALRADLATLHAELAAMRRTTADNEAELSKLRSMLAVAARSAEQAHAHKEAEAADAAERERELTCASASAKTERSSLVQALAHARTRTAEVESGRTALAERHFSELERLTAETQQLRAELSEAADRAVRSKAVPAKRSQPAPASPHTSVAPGVFLASGRVVEDAAQMVAQTEQFGRGWRRVHLTKDYPLGALRSVLPVGWGLQPDDGPTGPQDVLLYRQPAGAPNQWSDIRWYRFIDLLAQTAPGHLLDKETINALERALDRIVGMERSMWPHLVARAHWRRHVPPEQAAIRAFLITESVAGKSLLARAAPMVLPAQVERQCSFRRALGHPTPASLLSAPPPPPPLTDGSVSATAILASTKSSPLTFDHRIIAAKRLESEASKLMLESLEDSDRVALTPAPEHDLPAAVFQLASYLASKEQHHLQDISRAAAEAKLNLASVVPMINAWAERAAAAQGVELKDAAVEVDTPSNEVWVDQSLGRLLA